jgi:thymidylate synthase
VATVMTMESGRRGYASLARLVRERGRLRAPRGIKTYDLGHVQVVVETPFDALPVGVGRQLNTSIGAAEAVQLVAGRARHALLPRITPTFSRFTEPNGRFHGAYGDRVGGQVAAVVKKLHDDRDTRQAVITLWDPGRDNEPGKRDYPCTVALNFVIVDDRLELRTLMRSNDVWLGFPYDVFQFTQLQLTVARALRVEPGRYTHGAWSLHIYEEHMGLVDRLITPTSDGPSRLPYGFGDVDDDWDACQESASAILHGERPPDATKSEEWYVEQLRPYSSATR